MTNQTTPTERLFALIASIPGSGSVDWCERVRALLAEVRADTYNESADSAEKLAAAFHRRAESGEENGAMEVASVLRVAAGADAARAVSSVGQAPATDQTVLRERVDAAIDDVFVRWESGLGGQRPQDAIRDAVLAVLPATTDQTTDRGTVLREVEQHVRELARATFQPYYRSAYATLADDISRMADETQPAEAVRSCPPDCPCRAVCIGTLKPAAGARQDGVQS